MAPEAAEGGVRDLNQRPGLLAKPGLRKEARLSLPMPQVVELESSLMHLPAEGAGGVIIGLFQTV